MATKSEQIFKLIEAGYSKAEIDAIMMDGEVNTNNGESNTTPAQGVENSKVTGLDKAAIGDIITKKSSEKIAVVDKNFSFGNGTNLFFSIFQKLIISRRLINRSIHTGPDDRFFAGCVCHVACGSI